MRQRIAVDCDDVIANVNDSVREFINQTYGFNHTSEDYRVDGEYKTYWERIWGLKEGESADWFSRYIASGRMADLEPVDSALGVLERLKDRYSLILVTARSLDEVGYTDSWLARHAPGLFDEVTFVHRWQAALGDQVSKGEICQQLGANYLIDDNYDHCLSAAELGLQAVLFGDYGWNRRYETPAGVVRAGGWSEVMEFFDAA